MLRSNDLKIKPIEEAETIPSNWYTDSSILDLEDKNIFQKNWHLIGSKSKLKKPGSILVAEISKNPIIIIKQRDNSLLGFYNVCQHRGGPLAYEDSCIKSLQCKYHGWTYNLNGKLASARGFKNELGFDLNNYNLVPIRIEVWMGQIFANLNLKCHSISSYLGEIKKRIYPIDFTNYKFYCRESYKIRCNWKVYIDNFLEGYHIPFVHPKLNKVINYKSYKTELFDNFSLQWCPLDSNKSPYEKTKKNENVYYFTIFPNILLNIAPGRMQANIIEPNGPNNCIVHFDYHFNNPKEANIKDDMEFSELVQKEDIQICESVQKGLGSNGYNFGRFSIENESGVHHFQSKLKNAINN